MNVREFVGLDINYCEINREERNYAAIFFAALCRPGNPERFLDFCGFPSTLGQDFGIYFEYAFLRDLWWKIDSEETKKKILSENLRINGIKEILELPIVEINTLFGVPGQPSKDHIQFPGNWSLKKFNANFKSKDDLKKICRFKWSFNIKPDIVIHLEKEKAICIEAKYESGEGSYPSSETEKALFRKRGIKNVRQMELQKYMMEELLGIETEFMYLVYKKEKSETHKVVSWAEAFKSIDLTDMPAFAVAMAEKISG